MTINEKLDAVVAECERRCPKTYDIAKYQWGCLHSTGQFWVGRLVDADGKPMTDLPGLFFICTDGTASPAETHLAYDLLGLAVPEYPLPTIAQELQSERARSEAVRKVKKDLESKVEELSRELHQLRMDYKSDHARSAKLVEALENIANWYECTHSESRRIAQLALAEWKGGQGE